jgi:broad specificity phosphatase PhoE
MTNPITIYFVRHGKVLNPKDIYYGRLPGFPLHPEGREQAQAVAKVLGYKPLAAVFCSPQQRTRETADIILEGRDGLEKIIAEDLNEVYSPYDGRPRQEMKAQEWDVYEGNKPPFEEREDVLNRGQQFIARARMEYPVQHVVAVSHGDVIAYLTIWAKGEQITNHNKTAVYDLCLEPASITTMVFKSTSPDELPEVNCMIPYAVM